jgi:flagellar biosynthesis anti-sigma factor FlgM
VKAKTYLSLAQTAQGPLSRRGARERGHRQDQVPWKTRTRVKRAEKQRLIKPALETADRFSAQRTARVETLRTQVRSGTYTVDSHALAEKMIHSS